MRRSFLFRTALIVSILVPIGAYTGFYVLAQDEQINYGESLDGEIAQSGDAESWNFEGIKGDTVTIQVTRTGGNLIPLVTVEDPEGETLLKLDWPEQGPPTVLLSVKVYRTGRQTVIIEGDDNSTGTYTLSLELSESNQPGGTGSGILAYGDVASGEITESTFRQFWSFRGNRDDVIDVSMVATSGDLDAYLSLTSPEGILLYSTDSGGTGTDATLFAFKLPLSGTYTLSAQRAGANFGERGTTQGEYNLALSLRTPGAAGTVISPTVLSLGADVRGKLTADAPDALYTVTVQRQVFAVSLDLPDPAQVVSVSVMTPQRALLATFSGIAPLSSSVVVPGQGGDVWIEVSASGIQENTPVDFVLNIDQLSTAQQASRALLYDSNPRQISGSSTGETHAWYFSGSVGDLIEITVRPNGPTLGDTFSVYAPDGSLLLQNAVNTGLVQPVALRSNGLYELFLGPETVQTGYSIQVQQIGALGRAFDQIANPRVQGQLMPGLDHPISGQLQTDQGDAWFLDVAEPQDWFFSFTQTGSGLPPGLAVEAPDGTWLDVMLANRLPGANNLRVHLPTAGRYHVVVFEPSGQRGSTYTFHGYPILDGKLPLRTVTKGVLTSQKPADFWEIATPPDALLSLEMDLLGSSNLPYLHIMGPDGILAASNAQGEQRNATELSGISTGGGGVFRIVVSQPLTVSTITTYHIKADIQTPFQAGQPLVITDNLTSFGDLPTPDPAVSRVTIASQLTPAIKPDSALLASAQTAEPDVLHRGHIVEGALYEAWSFNARRGELLEFSITTFDTPTTGPDLVILDGDGTVLTESFKTEYSTNSLTHRFQDAGRYYIVVGLEHGGSYTLWIDELSGIDETVPAVRAGDVMAYGETRFGEIVELDHISQYVFYGHEADQIIARVVTTQGNLRLHVSLLDAADNVLSEIAYDEADVTAVLENVRLPAGGVYQLVVSHALGAEATFGQFALHLNIERAEVLVNRGGGALGPEQVRSLSRTDFVHRWLFDAQSGEAVTIGIEAVTESLPSPLALRITDTAGNVFLQREANLGNQNLLFEEVLLPRTGIYQAVVTGGDQQSGIYRILLTRDQNHTRDNPGVIRYGETVGQILTQTNYLDVWSFAGSSGDVVSVAVSTIRGDATSPIGLQIRSMNGEVLATVSDDNGQARAAVRELVLPSDGFYSVAVGNLDGSFMGEAAYALTVQLEDTPARSMGTVMQYGQVAAGDLYPDDRVDVWLFQGQQGDVITAELIRDTTVIQPSLSLVSTDWHVTSTAGHAEVLTSVQVVENESALLQSFVLPVSGAYAFVVQNATAGSGSYHLSLEGQSAAFAAAKPITPGYPQHALISSDNLFQAWTFDGLAGSSAAISVTLENRSTLAPGLILLAPDGALLAQMASGTTQIAQLEAYPLVVDGTYTVIVTRALGEQGRTVGGYVLDVRLTPPSTQPSTQTTYGRLERSALNQDTPAERWSFIGQSGDVVRIRAEMTSGTLDPVLKLYSPEGYLIGTGDDAAQGVNAEITATLAAEGLYEVEIERYGGVFGTTEGNYTLYVEQIYRLDAVTSEPLLVYGDRVTGTTDTREARDSWTFAGEQGDVIRVRIRFPVDDAPLSLLLRDPASVQRIEGVRERGSAIIDSFSLPASGLYIIEVRRPGDARAEFSPYELELDLSGTTDLESVPGGYIPLGRAVIGGFNEAPATHDWIFEGSAGQSISILLSRLSGTFSLQMMLVAPDGTALFQIDSASGSRNALSTGAVKLPLDGLYTLLITGQAEALGSKYRLSMQSAADDAKQLLSSEQDVFGLISSIRPHESWYFEAQAGDTLSIRAAVLEGDLQPTLMLWGPDARPLIEGITKQTSHGMQADLTNFTVPLTGTYHVVVSREMGSSSGGYRLMLRRQPISTHAAAAVDLAFDHPYVDYLPGTVPQLFAFQGLAGDVVGLGLQMDDGIELPEIVIETENGSILDLPMVKASGELSIPAFVLPHSGRYVIVLNGRETAQYTLVVFRRAPEITVDASTRNLGRERSFREAVDDASEPTYWILPGRRGEVINFTVDTTNSGLRADITLYGPQGYIASATGQIGSPLTTLGPVRLPSDGSYTLLVGPWLGVSGGSIGQYTIRAESAPASVSGSNGGHLAAGVMVTGGFIPEDVQDVWTYDATAGEIVTIRAEQMGGDGSLVLKLVGADGAILVEGKTSTAVNGVEIVSFMFASSSRYEIVVEGVLSGDGSIEYRLALAQDQSPMLASMKQASGIGYGEMRESIFPAGSNYQAWVFYGQQGERIASSIQTDESLALYLVGPGGDIQYADAGQLANAAIRDFVLLETGFYGLVVSGHEGVNYTISLEQVAAGAAMQGSLEETNTGQLTVAAPVHEWEIAPSYSGRYLVRVVSLIPSTPLDLFVLSLGDALLTAGTHVEPLITQTALRLEAGEHYTVVISGGPASAQGHYQVSLTPAGGGGALESGISDIGRITAEHFTESWNIQGQTGHTLMIDIARTKGDFVPSVAVFDDTGTWLTETTADEDGYVSVSLELPKDGDYTVLVSRSSGGAGETWGDYTITTRLK